MRGLDVAEPAVVSEEELSRARLYRLLSRILGAPADAALLEFLKKLEGDETTLGQALGALSEVAGRVTLEEAGREFHDLFIGVTQGELLPFASHYLTGFLNEKPLAELREEMNNLGISRSNDSSDPEDHIASLCEIMHGMIIGEYGASYSLQEQRNFFFNHVGNWAVKFFDDLEAARAATLFMPVGLLGRMFFKIEEEAFSIAA